MGRIELYAKFVLNAEKPLKQALDPAMDGSLRSRDSASLRRQLPASEAGPPLDQILDLHLQIVVWFYFTGINR